MIRYKIRYYNLQGIIDHKLQPISHFIRLVKLFLLRMLVLLHLTKKTETENWQTLKLVNSETLKLVNSETKGF